jgi:hypothetical protein
MRKKRQGEINMKLTAIIWSIMNIIFPIFDGYWEKHLYAAFWLLALAVWTWLREKYEFRLPKI